MISDALAWFDAAPLAVQAAVCGAVFMVIVVFLVMAARAEERS